MDRTSSGSPKLKSLMQERSENFRNFNKEKIGMPEECVDILYSFYFIHTFYLKKMFRKSSFVVVIALNAHAYLKYV